MTEPRAPHHEIITLASPNGDRSASALTSHAEIDIRDFNFYYGSFQALDSISMSIAARHVTALIGASGCGKSTLLRAINRMHDDTPGAQGTGELIFDGDN